MKTIHFPSRRVPCDQFVTPCSRSRTLYVCETPPFPTSCFVNVTLTHRRTLSVLKKTFPMFDAMLRCCPPLAVYRHSAALAQTFLRTASINPCSSRHLPLCARRFSSLVLLFHERDAATRSKSQFQSGRSGRLPIFDIIAQTKAQS